MSNYVGIDLGGTRIKIGLVNDDRGLIASKIINADASSLGKNLPVLKKEIFSLLKQNQTEVRCIGVAYPGLVDTDLSKVIGISGKYEDADNIDIVKWAREELGMVLKLENDARLACLGEWHSGAGRGADNLVMCTLGTGVGTSAIINGQILRGKHYQAGILGGHSIIDYSNLDHVCSCGNYGCVESIASTWTVKTRVINNPLYSESLLKGAPEVDFASIFTLSKEGDRLAIELREHCLKVWGIGIVNLIHAYDPEVVIVGGGISRAKDILVPYFTDIIKNRAWTPWGTPEIRIAEHPDTAALLGVPVLFK